MDNKQIYNQPPSPENKLSDLTGQLRKLITEVKRRFDKMYAISQMQQLKRSSFAQILFLTRILENGTINDEETIQKLATMITDVSPEKFFGTPNYFRRLVTRLKRLEEDIIPRLEKEGIIPADNNLSETLWKKVLFKNGEERERFINNLGDLVKYNTPSFQSIFLSMLQETIDKNELSQKAAHKIIDEAHKEVLQRIELFYKDILEPFLKKLNKYTETQINDLSAIKEGLLSRYDGQENTSSE